MSRSVATVLTIVTFDLVARPGIADTQIPIPGLDTWEQHMTTYGAVWGDYYIDNPDDTWVGGNVYYDGQEVQERIAEYLLAHGASNVDIWYARSQAAEVIYEDNYVIPNDGVVPGYYSFPMGLYRDYVRTGDPTSAASIELLRQNAAYHVDGTPIQWTALLDRQRESAYALRAHIYSFNMLGNGPRSDRYGLLAEQIFGDGTPERPATSHVDQMCISKSYVGTDLQAAPFMAGLMMRTMILLYEQDPDFVLPRSQDTVANLVPPAIKVCLDALWEDGWDPNVGAFKYDLKNPDPPQPYHRDLNLLIAPAYAWYYWYSKVVLGQPEATYGVYRDRFNQIFEQGVAGAAVDWSGKIFNQNYTWSFDGVDYYLAAQATPDGATGAGCGDGVCGASETCETCAQDCGACPPPANDTETSPTDGNTGGNTEGGASGDEAPPASTEPSVAHISGGCTLVPSSDLWTMTALLGLLRLRRRRGKRGGRTYRVARYRK